MKAGVVSILGIITFLTLGAGCQTNTYSSARSGKESLKDYIRTADSLNALMMGDSVREIKVEVREQLRVTDSSKVEVPKP
ncbi:MAG: hypothetical protein AAGC85_18270 [Bacteroidota bacterium]